jgi:phage shock protein A
MALINRISRLFRADLHAVLDRIEEPGVLLRQAVREMEEELVRDEQRLRVLDHEHGRITARRSEIGQALAGIGEELDLCFASGKDDLARALIRRRLEVEGDALQENAAGLRRRLDENRARLHEMRQKVELLAAEQTPDQAREEWMPPDLRVRDEDVEVAFLREQQKRRRP